MGEKKEWRNRSLTNRNLILRRLWRKFALDNFRHDITASKEEFKRMCDGVDSTTSYAGDWLPQDYRTRNIGTFGKTVFENIISSTVEHRRNNIIECVNAFDDVATRVLSKMDDDVNGAFRNLLNREVRNIKLSQNISYNDYFKKGNSLFESIISLRYYWFTKN